MLNGFGQTQQQILKGLLENKVGLTIDDMVKASGITRTAVHQHVNSLARDGFVEKHALTKTRGRPGQVYALTDKGVHLFPKQYAWFSELLIANLEKQFGSEGLENFLRQLGESVADDLRNRLVEKTRDGRAAEIANIMQELGYQASVSPKSGDNASTITAYNCVYHHLASKHREICNLDLALLSSLSGRKVAHTECMVRGGRACRFKIKEKLKKTQSSDFQGLEDSRKVEG